MTASDDIHAPLSPAATATPSSHSNRSNAAAANSLHVRKPQVQRGADHDHAVARKVAALNEPQHQRSSENENNDENEQVHVRRRRKRDVFFALFKHASKHDVVFAGAQKRAADASATTTTATSSVPVQIPVGYMNPDHKGCLVSGRRVSYSRHMHQGRKTAIAKKLECAIPEDEQVLAFPATQLQREQELERAREKAALEAAQNRNAIARSMFF